MIPPLPALAHELRTPLHGILGLVDLLRGTALDDEQRGHVAALDEAARAMLQLVEDALDLARLEDGRAPLAVAPCDPRDVLAGVARTVAPLAAAKGLALDVAIDDAIDDAVPGALATDAARLRQVLLNLAGNAVKYTHRGAVRLALRVDGDALVFDVVDTGPGLTAAQRARLFRAWERAGAEATPIGGAGLGLALAAALTARLGGALTVESTHGAGSTFTLRLPRVAPGG